MKLKKRIVRVLSLMLCAVLLAASLTACGDVDERGAYVNVYLGAEVRSWDPAIGFTDAAAVKYFSLVYEGLMTYDDNGKVVEAGAKEVNVKTNSAGEIYIPFDTYTGHRGGRRWQNCERCLDAQWL